MQDFFKYTKRTTAIILIVSLVFLVFFSILSIWEILESDVLYKALTSMGVIATSSALIIVSSMIGIGQFRNSDRKFSVGRVFLIIIALYLVASFLTASISRII